MTLQTICAPATAPGGALAIIRVSGSQAIDIAARIFVPQSGKPLTEAKGQSLHYGIIKGCNASNDTCRNGTPKQGETIDEAMASVFRAPHSFTGEDSVEFSCHGSSYIVGEVLRLLCANGCRMAMPGEFTKRAFLNGKIDLSQAEAVADLIASSSAAAHRIAFSQLKGGFSKELANLRLQLLKLTSLIELELDFSDHEELEFADRSELDDLANKIYHRVSELCSSFHHGDAIKNGIPVAIVGPPNAGKSTLLNTLLNDDKAIVSDIPGTTRDFIEGTFTIGGHLFRFIDTAGIRQTDDDIEQLGIERAMRKISEAEIVITIEDATAQPDKAFHQIIKESTANKTIIRLKNKTDLLDSSSPIEEGADIGVSARSGTNIDRLKQCLVDAANTIIPVESNIMVTNARHFEALSHAQESIQRVIAGLSSALPSDLIAEDLRDALHHLAEITGGEITTDETLSNIFSHFCIGK